MLQFHVTIWKARQETVDILAAPAPLCRRIPQGIQGRALFVTQLLIDREFHSIVIASPRFHRGCDGVGLSRMKPGIDLEVLRRTVGDDPVLMREVIEDFVPAAQAGVGEIRAAVESSAADGIKLAAHKLKGSASLVGARALGEVCAALEEASEQEDWQTIRASPSSSTT